MQEETEKKICKSCGSENKVESNFCRKCGSKLGSACRCWVIKKDSYDCGQDSCPGFGLFRILKSKSE